MPEPSIAHLRTDGSPIYGKSFTLTARDGAVTVNCAVGENQRLVDCRIVREQPEGKGYGAMAMAMVDKPEAHLSGNAPAGSRVEFTIRIREGLNPRTSHKEPATLKAQLLA
jgi:hypothetical protein